MVVKVSRSQRAAARRLIEIAEAEGQPVDERLEAIANAKPAEQSGEAMVSSMLRLPHDAMPEAGELPPESQAVYAFSKLPPARVMELLRREAAAHSPEVREQEEQERPT